MATNTTNVVVIVFALNILDSNRPIPEAMVDAYKMVGVVIFVV